MSNPSADHADLRAALDEIDGELERLKAEDAQIVADLDPSNGPADAADVAALTTAREENAALQANLQQRRATVSDQLGTE